MPAGGVYTLACPSEVAKSFRAQPAAFAVACAAWAAAVAAFAA